MGVPDKRYIKVVLDDAIIKALDEEGEERLRLAITVAGKQVLCRFPTYGDWDFFIEDLSKLMILISRTGGDIEIHSDIVSEEYFEKWAYILSQVLLFKECKELIEKIFFTYLRPEVEGLEEDIKEWMRSNVEAHFLFYMFTTIMQVEYWFKKKALSAVEILAPMLVQQSLKDTSPKNSTSEQTISAPGPVYEFN